MFGSEQKEPDFKINLGDEVKDVVTGFKGIVTSRTQWLHNCNVYGVQPQGLKDGKSFAREHFDEPQLKVIVKKVVKPSRRTGGPTDDIQQNNRD